MKHCCRGIFVLVSCYGYFTISTPLQPLLYCSNNILIEMRRRDKLNFYSDSLNIKSCRQTKFLSEFNLESTTYKSQQPIVRSIQIAVTSLTSNYFALVQLLLTMAVCLLATLFLSWYLVACVGKRSLKTFLFLHAEKLFTCTITSFSLESFKSCNNSCEWSHLGTLF